MVRLSTLFIGLTYTPFYDRIEVITTMKKKENTMLNTKQQEFVKHALEKFGKSQLTVDELKDANKKFGCKYAPQWLIKNKDYKVGKSLFKLPIKGEAKAVIIDGEKDIPARRLKAPTQNEEIMASNSWRYCS